MPGRCATSILAQADQRRGADAAPAARLGREPINCSWMGRKVRYASDSRRIFAAQRNDAMCHDRTFSIALALSIRLSFPTSERVESVLVWHPDSRERLRIDRIVFTNYAI
jgi:hypothetical protein